MKKKKIGFIFGTVTPEMKAKATYSTRCASSLTFELTAFMLDLFEKENDFSISFLKKRPDFDFAEMLHKHTRYFSAHPESRKNLLGFFTDSDPAPLFPEKTEYAFDQNTLFDTFVESDGEKLVTEFLESVDSLIIIGGSHPSQDPRANFEKVLTVAKERKIAVYRPRFFGEPLYPLFEKWLKRLPNGLNTDERLALMDSGNVAENIRLILKGLKSKRQ